MKPLEIYRQARSLGLKLKQKGNRLLVFGSSCPDGFAHILREHKLELLDYLEAKESDVPSDCAAWLPVARQVLAGEWRGATSSEKKSIVIGLRSIMHPLARSALGVLERTAKKESK